MHQEYPTETPASIGNPARAENSDQNDRKASTGVGGDPWATLPPIPPSTAQVKEEDRRRKAEAKERAKAEKERQYQEMRARQDAAYTARVREARAHEVARIASGECGIRAENLNDPANYEEIRLDRSAHLFWGVHTQVVFDDIEHVVNLEISEAHHVVGCIAWLTNETLLDTLAKKSSVSIVVQKEDFLRPDGLYDPAWKQRLRKQYKAIPGVEIRCCDDNGAIPCVLSGTVVERMNQGGDPVEAIRCFGMRSAKNSDHRGPLMHHKFAVLFGEDVTTPYAVITGSWNWTRNATKSIENILVIRDEKVAATYFNEYVQILANSEPLDWTAEYVKPEWRMGT